MKPPVGNLLAGRKPEPRELWERVEAARVMVSEAALGVQEKPMVECP